jgi:ABC-type transport system involved in cytochrome bd biosynthesis fused ATPase/permease subunit
VSRNPLIVDVLIAVVIVAAILIIEPGVAIAAILALVLLLICGVSYLFTRRRGHGVPVARPRRR